MTRVYLIEAPKKLKSGKRVSYYVLRWSGTDGKPQEESLGRSRKSGGKITKAEADELRDKKATDLGTGKIKLDKPERLTLALVTATRSRVVRRALVPAAGLLPGVFAAAVDSLARPA